MVKLPHIEQSCAVPYRNDKSGLEFALITSRNTGRWIVPKGSVEDHMTPQASAAKEALEEAGLLGEIGSKLLGEYFYTKFDRVHRVEIFSLRVTQSMDDWDEKHFRRREWVSGDIALERITELEIQDVIRRIIDKLN